MILNYNRREKLMILKFMLLIKPTFNHWIFKEMKISLNPLNP